jgi:hypothetical protein
VPTAGGFAQSERRFDVAQFSIRAVGEKRLRVLSLRKEHPPDARRRSRC